jgi:acyl-CoA-binding protein
MRFGPHRALAYNQAVGGAYFNAEDEDMSARKNEFDAAVAASKNLKERPDNDTLLQLYALYKQSTVGDVDGKRPGFTDMVGRAKYDAWAAIKGTGKDEAMKRYVALVGVLAK